MIVARLIDLEGITVCEMALPDDPENPRWYMYTAAMPKPALKVESEDTPYLSDFKRIEYKLERRTGDNIYIYRRVTGPWG